MMDKVSSGSKKEKDHVGNFDNMSWDKIGLKDEVSIMNVFHIYVYIYICLSVSNYIGYISMSVCLNVQYLET